MYCFAAECLYQSGESYPGCKLHLLCQLLLCFYNQLNTMHVTL